MLSSMSPMLLDELTEQRYDYECVDHRDGVDELLNGQPMSLAECWYGRSEMMSPVCGAGMMYMAAQQNKSHQLPFVHLRSYANGPI